MGTGQQRNLNRIVREYFPKGEPITSDPKYLAMVASDINDRPRKIHNWKKPSEISPNCSSQMLRPPEFALQTPSKDFQSDNQDLE